MDEGIEKCFPTNNPNLKGAEKFANQLQHKNYVSKNNRTDNFKK
jgi:hypothetical protein